MIQQRGAALIIVLSMLTMSLMLGISGIQSSLVEERLAGNYKAATEAQMGAEKAISQGWSELLSNKNTDFNDSVTESEIENMSFNEFSNISSVSNVCGDSTDCRYLYLKMGDDQFIVGRGAVYSGGNEISSSLPVFAKVKTEMMPNPVFTKGLLSAEEIRITGNSTVVGDVHSNGEVDINFKDEPQGSVTEGSDMLVDIPLPGSRPDSEDISGCKENSKNSHCYKSYDDTIFERYRERAGTIYACNIDLDSLSDGDTVFCEGSLVVGGGQSNGKRVTLVAKDDVSVNGATASSTSGGSEIGMFVVSGGNIDFNGNTDNYGVFWASGHVRQNGNSKLFGSIVAGTYIRSNGGIDFTSLDNITNPDAFVKSFPELVSWE